MSRRGQSHLTLGGLISCLRRCWSSFTRGHGSTAGSRLSIPSFLAASALTFILWQIPLPECFNKTKEVSFSYLQLFFFSFLFFVFLFGPSRGYPFRHFFFSFGVALHLRMIYLDSPTIPLGEYGNHHKWNGLHTSMHTGKET